MEDHVSSGRLVLKDWPCNVWHPPLTKSSLNSCIIKWDRGSLLRDDSKHVLDSYTVPAPREKTAFQLDKWNETAWCESVFCCPQHYCILQVWIPFFPYAGQSFSLSLEWPDTAYTKSGESEREERCLSKSFLRFNSTRFSCFFMSLAL